MGVIKQKANNSSALFGLGQCQEFSSDNGAILATYNQGPTHNRGDLNLLSMAESMPRGLIYSAPPLADTGEPVTPDFSRAAMTSVGNQQV